MAEHEGDTKPMTVEDCAAISRAVSDALDAQGEDFIAGEYSLEVSSPGIDRPLCRVKDYGRYVGHLAQVELTSMQEGRRRFKATIGAVKDTVIRFDHEQGSLSVAMSDIAKAKLVLTDALIKKEATRC